MCPNGHVMEASWDRCPYCPDPGRMGRSAVPPTRVGPAAAPAPAELPVPTPVPAPQVANKKTRRIDEDRRPPSQEP